MVVSDPSHELVGLVRDLGDPAPCEAPSVARRRAELIRRRFGLALPPPFATAGGEGQVPVRPATAHDAAAIAAVRWRAFGTSYRGILDDAFLDTRDVVPPVSYWIGRAMVPPSRRHRLFVWGRPGEVLGHIEVGPSERPDVGEVLELYVDPCRQGLGGGSRLLAAGEEAIEQSGFVGAELDVMGENVAARRFYESRGWVPTGDRTVVDLGVVSYEEHRYQRHLPTWHG